ncbi:MAG TPA: cation diffusion facilitator family transporter [Acidobacteriaceae bacterium]|jgi:cation diffusion facilitator family transporter
MSPTAIREDATSTPHAAKRSAAIFSVFAAGLVTLLKLITGLLTGSLGMLSEAAHSAIDLVASAITLFSVQVADRPADEDHNYGHGKVESLSAFVETGIMLVSCIWIVSEAISRIVSQHHLAVKPSPWPFVILLCSIVVDFTRSRALGRIAREHRSDALLADSVHFATDMWASLAVMFGLAATFAGEHYALPWLEYADPIAAIIVAGVILQVSWRLAGQTVDALLDATPTTDPTSDQPQTKEQLRASLIHDLEAIPGVLSVDRLRTRRSGAIYFADVTLGMPRNLTFQRSEQLTMAATEAVQRHLPGADVVVHTVPTAPLAESVHDRVRAVAARRNLSIHEINVQQYDDGLHVEQHLEVDETMPLRQAHELVTDLEAEMRHEVPAISSILTHIESEPATIERPASLARDRELEVRLRNVAAEFPEILDIHEVFVTRRRARAGDPSEEHIQVSCHCTLPDDLPMARVHAVITALEGEFKLVEPEVDRLLIHPEPATDNRR